MKENFKRKLEGMDTNQLRTVVGGFAARSEALLDKMMKGQLSEQIGIPRYERVCFYEGLCMQVLNSRIIPVNMDGRKN